ncbi:hypothetical protein JJB98_04745 [Bradyrhizobium diazoefficiens]|nr:hypothetical protein [Bradyrhizobium diazoefficiens]QQO19263.1 hypothetical protein JJB98_04745 [Bradyrhizobium diazoefficiens]
MMRPTTILLRRGKLAAFVAALATLAGPVASAGVLSGREFQNLIAGGPEGTTIVFQGGTDKIFYSPTLKNRLRLSPELGPDFLKQKILQNTVTEGTFIGATIEGGKWRTISGIAGVAADVDSGHGVLTLLQTFPEDTSIKAFQKRDRLYAVVIVEDAPSGVVCRRSQWERLFALKGEPKMTTVPCEFTVGNAVTPTAPR